MDFFFIYLRYYINACVLLYFLKWGSIGYSLGIVQWDFTRRDHPGNPGRVSGSGPVIMIISPREVKTTLSFNMAFEYTNNQAEYEALVIGWRSYWTLGQKMFESLEILNWYFNN